MPRDYVYIIIAQLEILHCAIVDVELSLITAARTRIEQFYAGG
jgi:hypothetical protein